jgi:hypothetical protein
MQYRSLLTAHCFTVSNLEVVAEVPLSGIGPKRYEDEIGQHQSS